MFKVHGEERHLGSHIPAAETRAEFDAVEQIQLPADAADAPRVQVAVPIADALLANTSFKQVSLLGELIIDIRLRALRTSGWTAVAWAKFSSQLARSIARLPCSSTPGPVSAAW